MAFERFTKDSFRGGNKKRENATFQTSNYGLFVPVRGAFQAGNNVGLYWDEDTRQLGLLPCVKGTEGSYALSRVSGSTHSVRVAIRALALEYGLTERGTFQTWIDKNGMMIVDFNKPIKKGEKAQ